ncbi:MAG: FRG domain-containing protein [Phycisphaerales bacterium]
MGTDPVYVFRGHRSASNWKLVASLHRNLNDWKSINDRRLDIHWRRWNGVSDTAPLPLSSEATIDSRLKLYDYICDYYINRMCAFATIAGETGLLTGAAATDATRLLNALRSERMHRYSHSVFINHPALTSLAQHSGIPTPFLDWTRNPLAALLFACEEIIHEASVSASHSPTRRPPSDASKADIADAFACVWVIPIWMIANDRFQVVSVVDQQFARTQSGIFTYDTMAYKEFGDTGQVGALEDVFPPSGLQNNYRPRRVVFPKEWAYRIHKILHMNRITDVHLRPTLPAIAAHCMNPAFSLI